MAHFGCVYMFGYLDLAFLYMVMAWFHLLYLYFISMYACICMDGWLYVCLYECMYALMNAHVCMYACMNAYVWTCARGCMNAIMYVCIGTGFEGVYSASEHWLFEEICPPRDIGIRGDLSTSGHLALEEICRPRDLSLIWFCPHAGLVFVFVYLAMYMFGH